MKRHDLEFVSIPQMVLAAGERFGSTEAVVDLDSGIRWSFIDVADRMIASVRAAIAFGIQPGDRVALCAPNCADWIVAALGVLGVGAILVPLNTRFKGAEAAYILGKSGAKAVLTVGEFLGNDYVSMLRAEGVDLPIIVIGAGSTVGATSWVDYLTAGLAVDESSAHSTIEKIRGDDVSDIMFTSGTTGAPKGVMLGHGQSLRAFGYLSSVLTFTPGDRYLIIPPFFHTFGYKCGWMACLMNGVCAIPQRTFDVDQVLHRLVDERVSILLGPPTLFTDLIAHPRRADFDLSALRLALPSAANVPPRLYRELRNELGFDVVLSAYGLTESTSVATTCQPDDDIDDIANSVGRPAHDIEVKLVDDTGAGVVLGEPGEVLIRGYNVTRGYWEDPHATAAAIDEEGWLHTGDIGTMDRRGFLKIVDRKKDMYIVGGFNAYPTEIEDILRAHEEIVDIAVIGVPDERMGEVGAAFVVAKDLTKDRLIAWARERLANYKVPHHVIFVDELPRNANMKVVKPRLREHWATRAGSGVALVRNDSSIDANS
ncbi:long-chain fatty acid--CoA ligase [Mycobacterium colombiense]|uniref:AMP-binding protein n=1 Tax=Mycobacterium colombiense TaxID=339268 RepID=UPI0007EF9EB0|nr:AMP-binding protein [Mycobacterium colombiense]OBK68930.1 long-chain fatty acid--CoA ligase [Mycobacterium colombiense]